MSNTINIGGVTVSKFYLGNDDNVKIYLGTTKLYPQDTPVTKDYFTFVVRDTDTQFKLSGNSVSYSLDSGTTWTSLASDTYSPTVSSGSTIMWKMTSPTIDTDNGIGRFYTSGGTFDVEGNIMSLLYGDNFEGQTALQGDSQFRGLFDGNTSVINASGLTLPATAMTANCYRSMFGNCSNLESAPTELPATSLAVACYRYMYAKTKVANAPSTLPATTLADNCYRDMFREAYFTTAPSLPATTLATYCYYQMFQDCTSLTTAPVLSATTLVSNCYNAMFANCTSLSAVTCLATTNLVSGNTNNMLNGISTLGTFERASGAIWPCEAKIPSTWSIIPAYTPIYQWTTSTDATDYCCDSTTYTKYYKDYYQVSNNNGCSFSNVTPEQWRQSSSVIEYDSVDCGFVPTYFTITSLAANNTITLRNNRRTSSASSFSYSTDNGTTWSSFSLSSGQTQTIATLASGDTLMMYGTNGTLASAYNYGHYFRGTQDYEVSGEISSLVNGSDVTNTELSGSNRTNTFAMLFSGDTHLVSAENLKISSSIMPQNCCNGMFRACTRLVKAPTRLPATDLGKECYSSMFEGCIALAYPPYELNFTSADVTAYNRMFCMSRTSKLTTPAMTYTPKLFGDWGSLPVQQQMFCGNGNLTTIYCYWTKVSYSGNFSLTNWVNYTADSGVTFYKRSTQSFASGVNGIKTGWTVVNDDTTQPT